MENQSVDIRRCWMGRFLWRCGVLGFVALTSAALDAVGTNAALAEEPEAREWPEGSTTGSRSCYSAAWAHGFTHCPQLNNCNVAVHIDCGPECNSMAVVRIKDASEQVIAEETVALSVVTIAAADVPIGSYTVWVGGKPLASARCLDQQSILIEVPVFELVMDCKGKFCGAVTYSLGNEVIRRFPALRRINASAVQAVRIEIADSVWIVEVKTGRHELSIRGRRAKSDTLRVGRLDQN